MLKKIAKGAGGVLVLVAALIAVFLVYAEVDGIPRYAHTTPVRHVEVTPARVARGAQIASLLCTGCHLNPTTGRLTGKELPDVPTEFGRIYSRNITGSHDTGIGGWTDGELAYFLRTGVRRDGQYVPPYMVKLGHLSDEDLDSVIAFLRSNDPLVTPTDLDPPGFSRPSLLTKALSHVAFRPLPYPTARIEAPPREDRVAYGRYLVMGLDCYSCHSPDFKKVDNLSPEKTPSYLSGGNALRDLRGKTVLSRNLTPDDETGIGRMTRAEFVRTLRHGLRSDGTVLHYPMLPMPDLTDDEAASIYAYLRTVPKIRNLVPPFRDGASDLRDGQRAYAKYGCVSCHGESGLGVGDLRKANEDLPTDGELLSWVLDAPKVRPLTKMPAFRGVIKAEDYAPLLAHVRHLSALAARDTRASNP